MILDLIWKLKCKKLINIAACLLCKITYTWASIALNLIFSSQFLVVKMHSKLISFKILKNVKHSKKCCEIPVGTLKSEPSYNCKDLQPRLRKTNCAPG